MVSQVCCTRVTPFLTTKTGHLEIRYVKYPERKTWKSRLLIISCGGRFRPRGLWSTRWQLWVFGERYIRIGESEMPIRNSWGGNAIRISVRATECFRNLRTKERRDSKQLRDPLSRTRDPCVTHGFFPASSRASSLAFIFSGKKWLSQCIGAGRR